ncbi:MAG: hypothetical protein HYZ50_00215 [Deltaproteobacteria bacterium]|nr:hypothetical protein [Deltaproteobacteria bacterium]
MQDGKVAGFLLKVGEGDLTLLSSLIAKSRDEQQIASLPDRTLSLIGRGAFLHHEMIENTAEDNDGKFLFLELDKEDAPRLVGLQWAELLDLFDFDGGLGVQAKLFRLIVERKIVKVVRLDRPVEFIAKIFHQ